MPAVQEVRESECFMCCSGRWPFLQQEVGVPPASRHPAAQWNGGISQPWGLNNQNNHLPGTPVYLTWVHTTPQPDVCRVQRKAPSSSKLIKTRKLMRGICRWCHHHMAKGRLLCKTTEEMCLHSATVICAAAVELLFSGTSWHDLYLEMDVSDHVNICWLIIVVSSVQRSCCSYCRGTITKHFHFILRGTNYSCVS